MKTLIQIVILTAVAASLTISTVTPVKEKFTSQEIVIPAEDPVDFAYDLLLKIIPVQFDNDEQSDESNNCIKSLKYWYSVFTKY